MPHGTTPMDSLDRQEDTTSSSTQMKQLLDGLSRLQWNQLRSDLAITASTRFEFVDSLTEAEAAGHLASITSWVARQGILQSPTTRRRGNSPSEEVVAAGARAVGNILEALLCHNPVRVNMFGYLTTKDARLLRAASSNCKQVVATHAWHDLDTKVNSVRHWRTCFPLATACTVFGNIYYTKEGNLELLNGVTALDVGCTQAWDGMFDHISGLRTLRMREAEDVTDACLLRQPELRELVAPWCHRLTNHGIGVLKHLTKLDVRWCDDVTPDVFASLPALCDLASSNITSDNIHLLPASLVRLELASCGTLLDAAFARLSCRPRLQRIRIMDCKLIAGACLAKLPALRSIQVVSCGFSLIVAAFRKFLDNPQEIINICKDIGDKENIASTYDYDSFTALRLDIVHRYADHVGVMNALYRFMGELAYYCVNIDLIHYLLGVLDERQARLENSSAVLFCLAAFVAQERVFATRRTLPVLFQVMRTCLGDANVCATALSSLDRLHKSDATLVESYLIAAMGARLRQSSAAGNGGIELMLTALSTHIHNRWVMTCACSVFSSLHTSEPLLDEIVGCGGVSLMCSVLSEYMIEHHLGAFFRCVGDLATHPVMLSHLISEDVVTLLISAIEASSDDFVLVPAPCDALVRVARDEHLKVIVGESGGIQVLVDVLRCLPDAEYCADSLTSVCNAICHLTSVQANAVECVHAGVLPILLSKLEMFATDTDVVSAIQRCILQLSKSSANNIVFG